MSKKQKAHKQEKLELELELELALIMKCLVGLAIQVARHERMLAGQDRERARIAARELRRQSRLHFSKETQSGKFLAQDFGVYLQKAWGANE